MCSVLVLKLSSLFLATGGELFWFIPLCVSVGSLELQTRYPLDLCPLYDMQRCLAIN